MDFGFNTALTGLMASQKSLYITSHNIANANTKGYSRQVGAQRATNPYSIYGVGFIGTGTEIYNVMRIRDSYVDLKYWNESAPIGEWNIKMDTLTELEKLFGEPSDSGIRKYLDDFYTSLSNVSKNPSDTSYREPVRESALALTSHINEIAEKLIDLKEETGFTIEAKVRNINSKAQQIANLNKQIYINELDGKEANDLRDKRDLLVDELSRIVNIRVDESESGKFRVSIGGITLVDDTDVSTLKLEKDSSNGDIALYWGNDSEAKIESGELKGLLDLYNGDGTLNSYRGIKYYQNRLNEFVVGFVNGFNSIHREGYGLNKTENGVDFFKYDGDNPAITVTLDDRIMEDLSNIAAAVNPGGNPEDNGNILRLISQRNTGEGFDFNSTPDDFIKSLVSNYSVDSIQAKRMYESQDIILQDIEYKRSSISGVSYDEEMANMIRYQQTYIASARMINTLDEIIDVTVNNLGLVGR